MPDLQEYVDGRRQEALDELIELLRIPSISTDESRKTDVARCAEHLAGLMKAARLATL